MTSTDMVQLWSVSRVYGSGDQAVAALDGVTTGFAPGTFTAVMGPSGSGKSRLLHCTGRDRPSDGNVVIDGTAVIGLCLLLAVAASVIPARTALQPSR
ncbi:MULTISPECIES: ATP-binding cassette domain-containing protein [Nonomuraea]|uniref:ATP-binding cassette domain-containing protein n=1 Tax=Nonomuraea mangrovi TaxID=2316207 RepID=A0ABW4T2G1_9ACTN